MYSLALCTVSCLAIIVLQVKGQNADNLDSTQDHTQPPNNEHLVDHLTDVVDLGGQGLRHIQEHLDVENFDKDSQIAEDMQAIENGDDTKGIFYFFELHDFDKNNKLDGLELFVALTDHHEKIRSKENGAKLLQEEAETLIDNLLEEHDLDGDGYVEFTELMNAGPDSLWNRLGTA